MRRLAPTIPRSIWVWGVYVGHRADVLPLNSHPRGVVSKMLGRQRLAARRGALFMTTPSPELVSSSGRLALGE